VGVGPGPDSLPPLEDGLQPERKNKPSPAIPAAARVQATVLGDLENIAFTLLQASGLSTRNPRYFFANAISVRIKLTALRTAMMTE
jgi:hypothetical protein